jgi:hypothetical protein
MQFSPTAASPLIFLNLYPGQGVLEGWGVGAARGAKRASLGFNYSSQRPFLSYFRFGISRQKDAEIEIKRGKYGLILLFFLPFFFFLSLLLHPSTDNLFSFANLFARIFRFYSFRCFFFFFTHIFVVSLNFQADSSHDVEKRRKMKMREENEVFRYVTMAYVLLVIIFIQ